MSIQFEDYYQTLGLSRDATADDIKRAYRKLARQYHPDTNSSPDAEAKFKQVTEAYEVLKDPERRQRYDQFGADYKAGQEFRPPPGFEQFFQGGMNNGQAGFSDFFNAMFGGMGGPQTGQPFGQSRQAHAPPQTLQEHELRISLHEAFHGTTRSLSLSMPTGNKTLDVKIPAGSSDGSKIRLAREGFMLIIRLAPDPRFEVQGRNLLATARLTPAQAALGDKIEVETFKGEVKLTVPPGTASGGRLRLTGFGLPGRKPSEEPGDLFVRVMVDVPKSLTDEQRALYEQLRDLQV